MQTTINTVNAKLETMVLSKCYTNQSVWPSFTQRVFVEHSMCQALCQVPGYSSEPKKDLSFFFPNYFIVAQLQLSAFSPHPSPPSPPNPPPSLAFPLGFVRVSFIVVPENPSPHCPFPPSSGYCQIVLNINVSGYILPNKDLNTVELMFQRGRKRIFKKHNMYRYIDMKT